MGFGSIARSAGRGAISGIGGGAIGVGLGALVGALTAPKKPKKPKLPSGPEIAPDRGSFGDVRPQEVPTGPQFLQGSGNLVEGMTDLQRRTAIATRATSGESSAYRDPKTEEYYRNLALYSLTGPDGKPVQNAQVLPVERQYLTQVLGLEPRNQSIGSFLSALLRAGGVGGNPAQPITVSGRPEGRR